MGVARGDQVLLAGRAGRGTGTPPSPPVEIRTLGGFAVLREGWALPAAAWQSRQARDLVKLLVLRRGRPVPREVLVAALWPEESSPRLAGRLSVLLSTARAVLDPGKEHPPEHHLRADRSAVRLDLTSLRVDLERFWGDSGAGLRLLGEPGQRARALALLGRAAGTYRGDLLEDDPYAEWAVHEREAAALQHGRVLRALARCADEDGDTDAAVGHRLRMLERDPFDEDAHLGIVSALAGAQRHGEARRRFVLYRTRMAELDVEPAPFPELRAR
ncbi:hypothetical protein NUM3379_42920 [Kineococcus sp. NUM-3379]